MPCPKRKRGTKVKKGSSVMIRKTAIVVLSSTAPAIQNAMQIRTLEEIGGTRAAGQRRGDIKDVAAALPKLYTDENNNMGWPAINFGACLCEAGKHVSVKLGGAKKTAALTKSTGRSVIPTIVRFPKGFYPFSDLDKDGNIAWDADARRTVNPATGGSNRTVRPLLKSWKCEVKFAYTDELSDDTMLELWKKAGEKAGMGDGRPSAPNKPLPIPHGTFEVVSFKIVKEEQIIDEVKVELSPEVEAEHLARNTSGNGRGKSVEVVPLVPAGSVA